MNQKHAVRRLRLAIAHGVRRPADAGDEVLAGILPWTGAARVGAKNPARPLAEQRLLDVLHECGGSVSDAAARLGGSTGQLSKVLTKEQGLLTAANAVRQRNGQKPLRNKR